MKKPIPFGKYDLLERINVGGMAEVFRAKAYGVEGFERLVAVKKILPNIAEDQEFITMFKDEAKIAVQLTHANIAQIYELGEVDRNYFIALEHVHGRDLRSIFERCRQGTSPMPVAQACFVIMKMCEGLDYAHNKRDGAGRDINLVHRDVSPQNILVSFEGEIKIIDFGIAKAAGKVGKTQAGILKGKFGYMSPEQVRGLPIDRRSDIFSAGICLYELLTNERLFVGESDFSTLEKVRNVEILPPSTYNRKIPDELERIVLKALARDVDDRYSNAIDLHDELQAFVYTAGEFYSRKDLAAWMKRTFAKEIEEETAKIEQYRSVPRTADVFSEGHDTITDPPAQAALVAAAKQAGASPRPSATPKPAGKPAPSSARITAGIRKATISMQAAVPPPSTPVAAVAAAAAGPPVNGRTRRPTLPPPPPPEAIAPPPPIVALPEPEPPVMASTSRPEKRRDLEWDEEELETQIYDSAPGGPSPEPPVSASGSRERDRPELRSSGSRRAQATPAFVTAPTLPSDASTQPPPSSASKVARPHSGADRSIERSQSTGARRRNTANGSLPNFTSAREPSLTARGTIVPEIKVRRPPSPTRLYFIAGLGAVAVASLVVGGFWIFSGDNTPAPKQAAASAVAPEPAPPVAPPVDPNSGFDVTTDPPGGKVKLDGNEIGTAPLRVRSLLAGKHSLEVSGLAGYKTATQEMVVEQGKALTLAVKLEKEGALPLAKVLLTSEPPGAKVTLILDGQKTALGVTPVEAKVEQGKKYEALFELDGHAPVTRAVSATDGAIAAVLGKTPEVKPAPAPPPKQITAPTSSKRERAERDAEKRRREREAAEERRAAAVDRKAAAREAAREKAATAAAARKPRETAAAPQPIETTPSSPRETSPSSTSPQGPKTVEVASGSGKITLGAKPPCQVIIDGKDLGRTTPVIGLDVKSGPVQVTLVNSEFGIKESFTVNVKTGETSKVLKDYTDRIPK